MSCKEFYLSPFKTEKAYTSYERAIHFVVPWLAVLGTVFANLKLVATLLDKGFNKREVAIAAAIGFAIGTICVQLFWRFCRTAREKPWLDCMLQSPDLGVEYITQRPFTPDELFPFIHDCLELIKWKHLSKKQALIPLLDVFQAKLDSLGDQIEEQLETATVYFEEIIPEAMQSGQAVDETIREGDDVIEASHKLEEQVLILTQKISDLRKTVSRRVQFNV